MASAQMLENFADCRMVKVAIPLRDGRVLHADGVLKQFTSSLLEIRFPSQPLPLEDIHLQGRWRVTFDKGISFLSVWALLGDNPQPHQIALEIIDSEANSHARRDHRVNTEIYLRYWQGGDNRHPRKPLRTRVNLSGCGISFQVENTLPPGTLVEMELILPEITLETVQCLGKVIRMVEKTNGLFEAAFELVNMDQHDMEKIIHFSMTEQFKMMQTKTRLLASTLNQVSEFDL